MRPRDALTFSLGSRSFDAAGRGLLRARGLRSVRGDVRLALAIAAGVVLLQLPICRIGVSLLDEGAIVQIAEDVHRGLRPYRDAVYPAFPGVLYVTAAAFALGGTSVETARVLAATLFAIAAAAFYLIARWRLSRSGAGAALGLFLLYRVWAYPAWQFLNYSTLAVTLALLATVIVGEALAQERSWPFVLAGACGAAAFLSKQDSGLVVAVQDNGIGIAREEQGRLFKPYSRLSADRQRHPGLGLGLALSKQVVELHGGRIWVESEPGKGSTFSFSIPRRAAARGV